MTDHAISHAANYKPGFYDVNKPYRDCLVAALKHFGLTKFSKEAEFWTLGGKEWHEYRYLLKQGLIFGEGSYHNVDREEIDPLDDPAVVAHKCEFQDIWELWHKPAAICFDSTNALVKSNEPKWIELVSMGLKAAGICGKTSLNWNFLTTYGNAKFTSDEYEVYKQWLTILVDYVEVWGLKIEIFSTGVQAPKEGSNTIMMSGHCLISN